MMPVPAGKQTESAAQSEFCMQAGPQKAAVALSSTQKPMPWPPQSESWVQGEHSGWTPNPPVELLPPPGVGGQPVRKATTTSAM